MTLKFSRVSPYLRGRRAAAKRVTGMIDAALLDDSILDPPSMLASIVAHAYATDDSTTATKHAIDEFAHGWRGLIHEERASRKAVAPNGPQLVALRAFAAANGRSWKMKLLTAWETGRYRDCNGADDEVSLQQVRNALGPRWLAAFKF